MVYRRQLPESNTDRLEVGGREKPQESAEGYNANTKDAFFPSWKDAFSPSYFISVCTGHINLRVVSVFG
jgi:hypothetical protein